VTITYENIQNVSIRQGPVQRLFGISDVLVETAGGGGAVGPHGERAMTGHEGLLEGIDTPVEIRDLIMAKWRSARSAGLGDDVARAPTATPERLASASAPPLLGPREQQVLEQIRDLAVSMAAGRP
jgi:hypothetical protein